MVRWTILVDALRQRIIVQIGFFEDLTAFARVLGNPAFQLDHQACIPVQGLEDLLGSGGHVLQVFRHELGAFDASCKARRTLRTN